MRVVVVSDLHVGSRVGLANQDAAEVPGGDAGEPVRRALYEAWCEATSGPWAKPDALVVNGDAIDGQNRKSGGIGTWTTSLYEQAEHAVGLLKMWRAKRIYVIRGSGYHVEASYSGLQVEEYIAQKLKAEEYPNQDHMPAERRQRSGWHWYLHFDGVTFHFSHRIGVSKVFHYQSTPTARQMLQAKLNDQLRHEMPRYKTDCVVRSHAHYYNSVEYSGSQGWVTPCWKALDEWMQSNGPLDISPDIGFIGWSIRDGQYSYEKRLCDLTHFQRAPLSVVGVGWRKSTAGVKTGRSGGRSRRTAKGKQGRTGS
ncbi:MAG: hypothetical protein GXX96_31360 [Planctomycetaceae bacterium]|nr:hypothetical protein [Planctomycetaceae bacterium]